MAQYIEVQISTDPQDILNEAYTFLQSVFPGWTPAVPNLDVWLLMAIATVAAESRDVASAVPKSIFRWFGANLINLPPIDDTAAHTTTTWTMIDNAGHTIPDGTQVSIVSGDVKIPFVTQGAYVVPVGSLVATPITIVAITPGADGTNLGLPGAAITLEDPLDFVSGVVQIASTTGGADAETDDAYVNRLATQLQLLAPRPILPADFAIFARNIANVYRAVAIDGYNPAHNILTANEASAETDASGWVNVTNATVASTSAQAADGTKSISLTAIAAADMAAALVLANSKTATPGETITGLASFRTAVSGRACRAELIWLDNTNTQIGATVTGAIVNDLTTGFLQSAVTAVAPAGTVKVRLQVRVFAPALGEVHYIDKMSIRHGLTTDWVPGGTSDTGNPRTVAVAGLDVNGTPVDAPTKLAIVNDLQARREVNFIINIVDPIISAIDVTYNVKMMSNYDSATVVASVNAALAAYLNPSVWGSDSDPQDWLNQPFVRYLEVSALINSVPGVDYITTTAGNYDLQIGLHGGTLGRVDVPLPGVAPLPTTVGATLTGTAV